MVSLPDTEATENLAEQVVGAEFAGDLAQRLLGVTPADADLVDDTGLERRDGAGEMLATAHHLMVSHAGDDDFIFFTDLRGGTDATVD